MPENIEQVMSVDASGVVSGLEIAENAFQKFEAFLGGFERTL